MIRAEGIGKKYKKKNALSEASFEIHENEIVALVGPNGAGKSTLLRILADVNAPTFGTIRKKENLKMGAVFDFNGLYSKMTAYENLSFFYQLNQENPLEVERERIESMLTEMGLQADANRPVKGFSKGMARKLAISRALLSDPDLLLLDEPFDGIDIQSHAYLMQFLRNWVKKGTDTKGKTVIFSSHNMSDIEDLCDRVLLIKKGHLKNNLSMIDLKDRLAKQYKIVLPSAEDLKNAERVLAEKKCPFSGNKETCEVFINGELNVMNESLKVLLEGGIPVTEASPMFDKLEDIYLAEMGDEE